ncbi:MAG: Hypoxanthine phosphoribosyltransferase [Promethearchaeota archaeon]|nr:MAG: Hypoxanthine phosphoribosyltransferase [Candidatus Lokiarchaeota archaeon]
MHNSSIEIAFVELSSYGNNTESSGNVKFIKQLGVDISEREVLIVEDIIDSGYTSSALIDYLAEKHPTSIKLCSLTSKPSRREKEVEINYLGFKIPNKFIVGYGFDFQEKYRNLPEIYYLKGEK